MYIHGEFDNLYGVRYSVHITDGNNTQEKIIGENGLFFGADPVTVEQDVSDTFEHVIKKSATINLVTEDYIGNYLFATEPRDVRVTIYRGSQCVFNGFIEPSTFNQPYCNVADEFSINCIDGLSTLQYYNYKNATVRNFDQLKGTVNNVTFKAILDDALSGITEGSRVLYDLSKGAQQGGESSVFNLLVNDAILLGETSDDTMTKEDTLTEILKYLNLHIVQDGLDYYIFDWNTLKNKRTQWMDLLTNTTYSLSSSTIDIDEDLIGSDSTNISVADVYNSVKVKDEIISQDVVIDNPLDDLTNVTIKKKYMTQYRYPDVIKMSLDDAMVAWEKYKNALNGNTTERSPIEYTDYYCQFATSKNWKFYLDNQGTTVDTLYDQDPIDIIAYQKANALTPQIIKFGNVVYSAEGRAKDNNPIADVEMTPYLCISVNGNSDDTESGHYPTEEMLEQKKGLIEYVGNTSAGYFSPIDSGTTNYLVFSGKMKLQGKSAGDSGYYSYLKDTARMADAIVVDGSWCTRKWYTSDGGYLVNEYGYGDPVQRELQELPYHYSQNASAEDLFSKLPLLQCELTIGNKRLVETDMDIYGNSKLAWYAIGEEPIEDGKRKTTFSLGVNPKLDEFVIGQEYDMQNTVTIDMNLSNVSGTAIPIKKSDNLHGAIHFRILGAYNSVWEMVTELLIAPTEFWQVPIVVTDNIKYCLAHTENLLIRDFKCQLVTSSASNLGNNSSDDKDLVYCSAESQKSTLKPREVDFKFITQLSLAESLEKGISPKVAINTVINGETPLSSLYNATTNETAKAEEHYVDNYYTEYCEPKIKVENDLIIRGNDNLSWRNLYREHNLNKTFFVEGYTLNAETDTKHFKLKEL